MKMLIVDDEPHMRETLSSILARNGYRDVAVADDGMKALEMIETTRPAFVIADIRMPGLDGIELLSKAKLIDADIVFVFVSGFDRFEYAQQALRYGAFSYLLKPVEEPELLTVVKNAAATAERGRSERDLHARERMKAAQGTELLRKQRISELIAGEIAGEAEATRACEEAGIRLEASGFAVLLVSLDDYANVARGRFPGNASLYKFCIENIASETLKNHGIAHYSFPYEDGQGFWIQAAASRDICRDIQRNIAMCLKFTVTIGAGHTVTSAARIADSYQAAVKAVKQRLIKGNGQIVLVDQAANAGERVGKIDPRAEQDILSCFERGDRESLYAMVAELFGRYGNEGIADVEEAMKLNFQLILCLYKTMSRLDIDPEEKLGDELRLYHEANALQGIDRLVGWFRGKIECCFELLEEQRDKRNKRWMDRAREYIRSRYVQDITLDSVARHVNMSPGYFGKQFKMETGENFVDYIVQCRIHRSKELLRAGDLSVKEIASMVGFNDDKYFYKVFKKTTGVTPKEYQRW